MFPLAHSRRSPTLVAQPVRRLRPPSVSADQSWSCGWIARRRCRRILSRTRTPTGPAVPRWAERTKGVRSLLLDRSRRRGPGHTVPRSSVSATPGLHAHRRRRFDAASTCGRFQRPSCGRLSSSGCSPERPAPVAQRIEHLTTDQKVWGSNPYGRAPGRACGLPRQATGSCRFSGLGRAGGLPRGSRLGTCPVPAPPASRSCPGSAVGCRRCMSGRGQGRRGVGENPVSCGRLV